MACFLAFLCLFSFVGLSSAKDEAVVFVVDPTWDCVESYVANVPLLQEYKIIRVYTMPKKSNYCNSDHAKIYLNIAYSSTTPNSTLATAEICPKLRNAGVSIAAVIPTFDPAVYLADQLADCLGVRGNPVAGPLAKARRNKWVMSNAIKKAGLRSVKEKLVSTWSEAKDYLESLDPPLSNDNPVIYKILQGSSSEGVKKIYNLKQAEEVFKSEVGTNSWFGDKIAELLIQEYVVGKEYVIDAVSRNGVHKVVMVWYEDLRPGNGISFLYYGFKTMDPNHWKTKAIIEYANAVLDATGLQNGASDMEVKWIEEEGTPCLLDLNARWTALMWHDGLALENALTGNNQITATINAYLDEDAFNNMPPVPSIKQHGAIMFVNAFHAGILKGIPGLEDVKKMPSYFGNYKNPTRGVVGGPIVRNTVGPTPVMVLLADSEEAVLDADYNRIIHLDALDGFYDIVPSAGYTSFAANGLARDGLPHIQLLALAALAMLAAAAARALATMSRQNVRDDTVYLSIE
jgi:biotin carboxylase